VFNTEMRFHVDKTIYFLCFYSNKRIVFSHFFSAVYLLKSFRVMPGVRVPHFWKHCVVGRPVLQTYAFVSLFGKCIMVIKSRRMTWAGHLTRIKEVINAYRNFNRNCGLDLSGWVWGMVAGSFEHGDDSSGSIKGSDFLTNWAMTSQEGLCSTE
jgi:hypothetical protein